MNFLQKPVTCSEPLVYLSKVNIYVNEHISGIRIRSLCVIVHKQVNKSKCLDVLNRPCTLMVFSDMCYGCSFDDNAHLMYGIPVYQFQLYKVKHYCKCDIDFIRLNQIHIYTCTDGLSTNYSTMSLQYRKKDKICKCVFIFYSMYLYIVYLLYIVQCKWITVF